MKKKLALDRRKNLLLHFRSKKEKISGAEKLGDEYRTWRMPQFTASFLYAAGDNAIY